MRIQNQDQHRAHIGSELSSFGAYYVCRAGLGYGETYCTVISSNMWARRFSDPMQSKQR